MGLIEYIGAQKIIKENRYVEALFRYGVVSLLLLLDEYEEEEDYQECEIIKKAIEYVNDNMENQEKLPTIYDSKALSQLKDKFNLYGAKGTHSIEDIRAIKEMVEL